jgi:hypothetical protein
MVKKKQKTTETESDSTYFLKLVLYIIMGTLWIKFTQPIEFLGLIINGLPIGLFVGLFFASHDHFQIDRKIEYAILIVMTIVTYFLPAGIIV